MTESCQLKDRDLVQVGPLTFAVSIEGAPAAAKAAAARGLRPKAAPEDVSHDDIESWLIADSKSPAPERPSGVYPGDTITITAFKDAAAPKPPAPLPLRPDTGSVRPTTIPTRNTSGCRKARATRRRTKSRPRTDAAGRSADEMPEEFIDESNPFYVKKKAPEPTGPSSPCTRTRATPPPTSSAR